MRSAFIRRPTVFDVSGTIILMGADRTSIHNAGLLPARAGLAIDEKNIVNLSIGGAQPYQLPVSEWKVSRNSMQTPDGQKVRGAGIYVFWFVADGEQTPDHFQMMRELVRGDLLRTGVLQRWAYVSYFSVCAPGQEDATFARMEKLIAASVPEFQLPPARR